MIFLIVIAYCFECNLAHSQNSPPYCAPLLKPTPITKKYLSKKIKYKHVTNGIKLLSKLRTAGKTTQNAPIENKTLKLIFVLLLSLAVIVLAILVYIVIRLIQFWWLPLVCLGLIAILMIIIAILEPQIAKELLQVLWNIFLFI